jgi:hypothetical protein
MVNDALKKMTGLNFKPNKAGDNLYSLKDLETKIFHIYEKPKLNDLLCGTDVFSHPKPQQSDLEDEYHDPRESRP